MDEGPEELAFDLKFIPTAFFTRERLFTDAIYEANYVLMTVESF